MSMKSFYSSLLILIILSIVPTRTLAADGDYWELEDANGNKIGAGKKCPYDETRLFKHIFSPSKGPEASVESCYAMCNSIQDCHHFSYGIYQGEWMCMGCNGHEYGYEDHDPFTVYELKPRDDWEFTKVSAKRDCSNQRDGDKILSITQEECHTLCKDTQGCGYFSMKDMNWNYDAIGSGTCQLCTGAAGFASQEQSNTYSVLSPPAFDDTPDEPNNDTPDDANDEDPTPDPAGSNGDPHFKTWLNEHYEFHGQCDMVLTRDPNFANGLGFEVQIRTKIVRFWSYIRSAAIRIGDDILEIEGSPDLMDRDFHYWFNFGYQKKTTSIGGFPLSISTSGVTKRFYEIDLSPTYPGQKIILSTFREFISVKFEGTTSEAFGNTVGMLGNYETGKTLARDGATNIDDFTKLGNEWQVIPSDDMLFHDIAEPQFPKKCIVPEDPRGERRRRLDESKISMEAAEAACQKVLTSPLDIKDCVYDILATQDLDMVGAF